ncbi:Adenosine deaminase-like protein [Eumeta japonica]|uniref:Adenosine deaminase-like protein n=1 Tax=Eumeta variegata TaxID=151549 RepID=A0A4C1SYD0_EUMVA|nr:Adenosine deaminase-like protein [Eumeta japonica]
MVIKNFSADNVIYLELRTTPKANEYMTRREYVETLIQAIEENSVRFDIQVKLLLSVDRAQSVEIAEETVNLALEFNKKYPDIVKGMDLSGSPYKGKFSDFLLVLTKAKESKLNLALHCAEICNPLESGEMINYGFQRCGHGTF